MIKAICIAYKCPECGLKHETWFHYKDLKEKDMKNGEYSSYVMCGNGCCEIAITIACMDVYVTNKSKT